MTKAVVPSGRLRFGRLIPLAILSITSSAYANPDAPLPPSYSLGGNIYAASPATLDPYTPRDAFQEPKGSLSLRQALAVSLLQNPGLEAFAWASRAQEAEALQAGLLPNPTISVEAENFAGSGPLRDYDGAETTVMLGQLVELGRKRSKRRQVAELERDLADWDYETRRLEVLTAVTQEFVNVLEAQRRLALADELRRLARESLNAVSKRVKAGAASSVEETRAGVNYSSAEVALRRAEAGLEAARARLASQWGSRLAAFDTAVGELDSIYRPPSIESIQDLVQTNPDIARWTSELNHREAVVSLEDSQRVPDFTLGGGFRRFEGGNDSAVVLGITVPFPLFDRNQGARQAAHMRRRQAQSEKYAAATRVARDLEVSFQVLRASYDAVVALRDKVLPQAESAYSGVQTGYLQGLFRYVDVLDAQRTLFELRDRELTELSQFHRTAAEVERLTGTPLRAQSLDTDERN